MCIQNQAEWHLLSIAETLARLKTQPVGLSESEAQRRLQHSGPNVLAVEETAHPLVILLRQVKSPLIYLLLAAAMVTALLEKYIDTGIILAVVVLNSVVGFIQEYKAEQAMHALARLTAAKAWVLRDGIEREIDPREIVPGDIVILESGVRVPADLRLIRAFELQADESPLTGESLPTPKTARPIPDPNAPLGDRRNLAFLGTIITRGRGAGVVVATGMQTVFGQISAEVRQAGEVRSPLQVRLDQLARLIVGLVLGVTALVFGLGLLTGGPLVEIALTAVATAVATVPEGLPVVITVALGAGVWRMAQRKAIVRKLPAVETLGSCTVICSDKTGTLTRNEMTVTRLYACGQLFDVTGVGYSPEGELLLAGRKIDLAQYPVVERALRIGLLCNESSVSQANGQYRVHGDPTEAALIVAAMKGGLHDELEREQYPLLDEIPFESERQYMATLHDHRGERLIFVKGAPETIIAMCETADGGHPVPLDREAALRASNQLARQGARILAMAYRRAEPGAENLCHDDLASGLTFVALQAMIDPPRPEAIGAVARCQQAGIRVIMITGDHEVTAKAIALHMGIVYDCTAPVISGRQLEVMSDEELFNRVPDVSIFARAAPQHKLRIVQQLRRHGQVVAVTGDGVNDAPALKQADIGVAMGKGGTDVAREAADMVLADDNFASIYAAVEEGRVVLDNVRKVIMFLIPTGLGLVLTIIASMLLGLPLPFLPAQVIWLNLVTNGLQDVAMAFEPAEEDVGRRSPRPPTEGVLTRPMLERIALVGVVLAVGPLAVFVWSLAAGGSLELARTAAMTTHVLMKTFHIFNSRSFTRSVFRMNPLSNRFLFFSLTAGLGLHILALHWRPLQFALKTQPLSLETWLLMAVIAVTVLLAVEVDKIVRSIHRL